ncbi:Plasmodesmata callose-binding protein 3, partial [Mucuna pruriens]
MQEYQKYSTPHQPGPSFHHRLHNFCCIKIKTTSFIFLSSLSLSSSDHTLSLPTSAPLPNNMAKLALALLLLAFTGSSSATWCVCKDGSDAILQKTLDYACGAGADCNPLHQNGPCFQPNTVRAHCNYAVNSYFQRKGQAQGSCDFAGTATVTASNPSTGGCSFPASASSATSTGTTTTSSPYSSTPGVLGGIGSGMGPSGVGTNTDDSHAGLRLVDSTLFSPFSVSLFSGLLIMLWWG